MGCIVYLGRKNWVFILVSLLLIVVGLIFIIIGALKYETKSRERIVEKKKFGAVIDAGGSGTRLYVYEYENPEKIDEIINVKCEKEGLNTYIKEDYTVLATKLRECLQKASYRFPTKAVPLFMGATAGMRLLKARDETKYNEIWAVIKDVLNKSSFRIVKSETISGAEEAQWAFIAANLLKKTITKDKASVGIVEVGSSSVQIAFSPKTSVSNSSGTQVFPINGKNVSIYGHSYLCYGKKEIERRFLAKMIKDSGYKPVHDNPCYFSGYEFNVTSEYLWAKPCSSGDYAKDTLGEDITGPPGQTFLVKGIGNGSQCSQIIKSKKIVNLDCKETTCGLNGVFQPSVNGKFLGLSGLAYLVAFMEAPANVDKAGFEKIRDEKCAIAWSELKNPGSSPKYVSQRCFDMSYDYFLLTEGLKFDDQTWDIEFTNTVNGDTASWTLGSLYVMREILYERVLTKLVLVVTRNTSMLVLIAVGVILLLVGLVLLVLALLARRRVYEEVPLEKAIMTSTT